MNSGESAGPIEQRFGRPFLPAINAGVAAGQNHNGKLESLRLVDTHDAHGIDIFFGEHAFAFLFDVEHALLQLADSCFECHRAIFAPEQFGLPAQLVEVSNRLFAVKMAGS